MDNLFLFFITPEAWLIILAIALIVGIIYLFIYHTTTAIILTVLFALALGYYYRDSLVNTYHKIRSKSE